MGALDGGMAGDQLPGPMSVADAAPAPHDMAAAEQGGLEVQRIETAAALWTAATIDEFEDQATSPRSAHKVVDDALVEGHSGADHITARGTGAHGRLHAGPDVKVSVVPESRRGHAWHHCR